MTWNLGHQARYRPVPPGVDEVIRTLAPSVVFFNEFVHDEDRSDLRIRLRSLGYDVVHLSMPIGRSNQVLAAARLPLEHLSGETVPRSSAVVDDKAPANWLHLRLPNGLQLVGFRMPWYRRAGERAAYAESLGGWLEERSDQPIVLCGDFNMDPFVGLPAGQLSTGFLGIDTVTVRRAAGGRSWIDGSCATRTAIDHVAHLPGVSVTNARYHHQVAAVVLAGPRAHRPISDHAALTFEIHC